MSEFTKELAREILAELTKKTKVPFLRGTTFESESLSIFDSKVGGCPYWPADLPYPTNHAGEKLVLLAQINLDQIPHLAGLPEGGILQFFISPGDCYGAFEEKEKHAYAVIHHTTVDSAVSEEDVLALGIETSLDPKLDFPVVGTLGLRFEPCEEGMSMGDYRFETAIKDVAKSLGIVLPDDVSDCDVAEMAFENPNDLDDWYNLASGDKLLGYPYFTQYDPRPTDKDLELLFQLDSSGSQKGKNYVLWGDCGIGNFFITPADLAAGNFDNVFFSWDCC